MRFKIDTMENFGENWMVADFGVDQDGQHYILTTDHVRCSEDESLGPKGDAQLCADLLNAYYAQQPPSRGREHITRIITEFLTQRLAAEKAE